MATPYTPNIHLNDSRGHQASERSSLGRALVTLQPWCFEPMSRHKTFREYHICKFKLRTPNKMDTKLGGSSYDDLTLASNVRFSLSNELSIKTLCQSLEKNVISIPISPVFEEGYETNRNSRPLSPKTFEAQAHVTKYDLANSKTGFRCYKNIDAAKDNILTDFHKFLILDNISKRNTSTEINTERLLQVSLFKLEMNPCARYGVAISHCIKENREKLNFLSNSFPLQYEDEDKTSKHRLSAHKVNSNLSLESRNQSKSSGVWQAMSTTKYFKPSKDRNIFQTARDKIQKGVKIRRKRRLPYGELVVIPEKLDDSYSKQISDLSNFEPSEKPVSFTSEGTSRKKRNYNQGTRSWVCPNYSRKSRNQLDYFQYRRVKYISNLTHTRKLRRNWSYSDGFDGIEAEPSRHLFGLKYHAKRRENNLN